MADPEVTALIERTAAAQGITRRAFTPDEITSLALAAMLNRAALLLQAGIAQRPSDIDVVLTNGYGFPRRKGGPVFWASRQDPDEIETAIDRLAEVTGPGFERGNVAAMLASLKESG